MLFEKCFRDRPVKAVSEDFRDLDSGDFFRFHKPHVVSKTALHGKLCSAYILHPLKKVSGRGLCRVHPLDEPVNETGCRRFRARPLSELEAATRTHEVTKYFHRLPGLLDLSQLIDKLQPKHVARIREKDQLNVRGQPKV